MKVKYSEFSENWHVNRLEIGARQNEVVLTLSYDASVGDRLGGNSLSTLQEGVMKKFLGLMLLATVIGCAEIPAPQPKVACVQSPPPMLTHEVMIATYGHKQLDSDKMVVIEDIPSVIRFSAFLKASEDWKRMTFNACRDSKTPALVVPQESESQQLLVVPKGHHLDEDEE